MIKISLTKFLCIYIDEHLKWNHHIDDILTKVTRPIHLLQTITKYVYKDDLKTLYYVRIYPYITFGTEVWGSANTALLDRIYIMQKRARFTLI